MKGYRVFLGLIAGLLSGSTTTWADELTVFPLFTDHGILQQKTEAPIWGTAEPGAEVSVSFRGSQATAKADPSGKWMVRLKTPQAEPGQVGTDLTIRAGKASLTLKDVVVGEVWLGSGQSNMDSSLGGYAIGKEEAPKANYPEIRLYTGGGCMFTGNYAKCTWNRCTPETAARFSATGYFFSRDLHQALKVPVGFLNMGYSGSAMGMWVQPEWLLADPRTKAKFETFVSTGYPALIAKRKESLAAWEKAVDEAKAKGEKPPTRPFPDNPDAPLENYVGKHFRTHIAPVMPFACRGILWDQGEASIGIGLGGGDYDVVFDLMMKNWRKGFGQDLPAIYCQMPKGGAWGPTVCSVSKEKNTLGEKTPLAELPASVPAPGAEFAGYEKEADPFLRMLALPGCYMAVTRDLNVAVHPPDKDSYGHRFFLTALNKVYGQPVECSGPQMKSAKREGEKVRVSFAHVGSGLQALGGKDLQGFTASGPERGAQKNKTVWAKGQIDGDSVLLSAPELERIDQVSYAREKGGRVLWANLFNKEGLPAYPMTLKVD